MSPSSSTHISCEYVQVSNQAAVVDVDLLTGSGEVDGKLNHCARLALGPSFGPVHEANGYSQESSIV